MQHLPRFQTRSREAVVAAPERHRGMQVLAWLSLLVALGLLIAALIYVPRGVGALLGGVSESRPTEATVLEGTVLVQPPATATWQGLASHAALDEGTRLRTDDRSRAFLRTRDGSTILIYNDTELAVQRMQYGRFNPALQDSVLRLFQGRVQIGVALHPAIPDRRISILAGDGRLDLAEGTYRVEMESNGTVHLSVQQGTALVWLGSQAMEAPAGRRVVLSPGATIAGPLPLERDLLDDPLLERLADGSTWSAFVVTEAGIAGTVNPRTDAIWFERQTTDGDTDRHGESGILQDMDRDVRDYVNLRLRIDVRTDLQTLSGGGTAGTEYPLMLRLAYLDAEGREQIWATGFYYQNDAGLSVKLGENIPAGEWITFDHPTLLQEIRPAPVRLRRIEVLGSGWEYRSAVRRVELTGY
jgi:hypothetical protein